MFKLWWRASPNDVWQVIAQNDNCEAVANDQDKYIRAGNTGEYCIKKGDGSP